MGTINSVENKSNVFFIFKITDVIIIDYQTILSVQSVFYSHRKQMSVTLFTMTECCVMSLAGVYTGTVHIHTYLHNHNIYMYHLHVNQAEFRLGSSL